MSSSTLELNRTSLHGDCVSDMLLWRTRKLSNTGSAGEHGDNIKRRPSFPNTDVRQPTHSKRSRRQRPRLNAHLKNFLAVLPPAWLFLSTYTYLRDKTDSNRKIIRARRSPRRSAFLSFCQYLPCTHTIRRNSPCTNCTSRYDEIRPRNLCFGSTEAPLSGAPGVLMH